MSYTTATPTFQSTLPARGATAYTAGFGAMWQFQSTLPARGAMGFKFRGIDDVIFQSTLPARGATNGRGLCATVLVHFNPRSPHGERQCWFERSVRGRQISIHAPRTGSDLVVYVTGLTACVFQSTLPARGATVRLVICRLPISDFNPRSPHGERRFALLDFGHVCRISIHAPRTGSDGCLNIGIIRFMTFQSTLPARGATRKKTLEKNPLHISIHAPRTGSDKIIPRDPVFAVQFQSTLPARGATIYIGARPGVGKISIHAPRTGSDPPSPPFGRCR